QPRWSLLSVGLPQARWDSSFLAEFYKGVRALAREHGVSIIGGDISRTPAHVVVDSVALGEVARGRGVLRSGARRGDRIYVTGMLGGAAAGLQILRNDARLHAGARRTGARRALISRQTRPAPRVEWGVFLCQKRLATAMIDLSDGLSSDLAHLCRESGVGAKLEAARMPVDSHIKSAGVDEEDALSLALNGGEDFELLFTVRVRDAAKLPEKLGGVPATYIGDVTADAGIIELRTGAGVKILKPSGFEHFKRTRR
ncbi:MAG TPA: thiamine-phosphate kinase, partial [Pyrinomonadaceae bacterium]|nr:thiamine-phosphate kinase [Pyrinomonadaceae bacterium]